jgi:hypothetical protein
MRDESAAEPKQQQHKNDQHDDSLFHANLSPANP